MSNYCEEDDEGFHFDPDDNELIKDYLIPKLSGKPCEDFIVMKNVYAKEPWLLDHNMDPFFQKNEWYYFVTRTQVSEKNIGCGKKVKRKITGDNNDGIDRGNWKADSSEDIIDKNTGKTIGTKQTLSFKKINSNNNKKQKRGGVYATGRRKLSRASPLQD
ncbi:unnamed protein product [Arabis nemorensis]|uniref:NAC domain-containing protein n=1 Tax=Arabis nemorensis TaxID=586526 RepID=A0A565CSD3_9BRAS|nr:unnamed protein product [Arabis nemorensis]